jgi:hypothetical protein
MLPTNFSAKSHWRQLHDLVALSVDHPHETLVVDLHQRPWDNPSETILARDFEGIPGAWCASVGPF